ncbi:hypothetical protein NDK50_31590 [Paraburkholderia bryophila]|uniref:hypothetical protein n=1 Tax=Paraburkholderia bryophila TaxID=420952 RepID=UPI00234A4F2C|nr:hypothetical protein [Paraburkholderia bryophila]WCM22550.1 hypothetical protein NDK50_31590 [Paraburkholderia bryophila]
MEDDIQTGFPQLKVVLVDDDSQVVGELRREPPDAGFGAGCQDHVQGFFYIAEKSGIQRAVPGFGDESGKYQRLCKTVRRLPVGLPGANHFKRKPDLQHHTVDGFARHGKKQRFLPAAANRLLLPGFPFL